MRTTIIFFAAWVLMTDAFAKVVTQEENFTIKTAKFAIDLSLDGGKIQVLPSGEAHDCRVSMNYPQEKCSVSVRYNEKRGQLDVVVDFKKWDMEGDDAPNLILEVPYAPEISLEAYIKAGETLFDLGDLTLSDFRLRHWAGETKVTFNEPNRMIMKSFDVNVKIGELTMENLGNARYEEGEINGGIGELHLDFHGESTDKCVTRIDLDLGETAITLPEETGVKMRVSKLLSETSLPDGLVQRGDWYYSENYDDAEQKLYLLISTGIGELNIRTE